jgi:hypothetical protein
MVESFELVVHSASKSKYLHASAIPFNFLWPTNIILSSVTSLVFTFEEYSQVIETVTQGSGLDKVLLATVNLRVFACNMPITSQTSDGSRMLLPEGVVTALKTRVELVSLSLTFWTTNHEQFVKTSFTLVSGSITFRLNEICKALPKLSHLCILVDVDPKNIVRCLSDLGRVVIHSNLVGICP